MTRNLVIGAAHLLTRAVHYLRLSRQHPSRHSAARKHAWRIVLAWSCVGIAIFSASAFAQQAYSPYVGQSYPMNVYWGDTHLHTSFSADAYGMGDRISPEDAYRFARGEPITADNGMRTRLRRQLDFLVIADHSEALGVGVGLEEKHPALSRTAAGQRMLQRFEEEIAGRPPAATETMEKLISVFRENIWKDFFAQSRQPDIDITFSRSIWARVAAAADRYNDPGRFTAFIGFEWTSGVDKEGAVSGNLHRVVIFKDGAAKAGQVLPFTAYQSQDPEALWAYMADYENRTGGAVLAIPHNGNLSNGEMFPLRSFTGRALSSAYARMRSRWEPLYEVTQIKGDSEAHPFLSPTDEFADYERWHSWAGKTLPADRSWNEAERVIKEGEYARSALKRGLALQAELGVNPFKFGLVGSTDAHSSLSAVEENNFWGKASRTGPGPDRATLDKLSLAGPPSVASEHASRSWMMASSGYAAVWAIENTREALFDGMKRKETYATTGPRIILRFFGGWQFIATDALHPDLALTGYRKGVPMGGDLANGPAGKAPSFLIRAVKDAEGANLDRLQVIKGWRDASGELRERIHDVALSDGRQVDKDGKAPAVGSTVNVNNASYANAIGDPELAVVWTDPDFDPGIPAFYYVRVLEIPTPRWTAYDVKHFKLKNISPTVPMVIQERAYSSPIWFAPGNPEKRGG